MPIEGFKEVILPDGTKKVVDLQLAKEGGAYADAVDQVGQENVFAWMANNFIVIMGVIILVILIIYVIHIHNRPNLTGYWAQETTGDPVLIYLQHDRHTGEIYFGQLKIGRVLDSENIEIHGKRAKYSTNRIDVEGFKATRIKP